MNANDALQSSVKTNIATLIFGRDGVLTHVHPDIPKSVQCALAAGVLTIEDVERLLVTRAMQMGVWYAHDMLESPSAYPCPEKTFGWSCVVIAITHGGLSKPEKMAIEQKLAGRTSVDAYAAQADLLIHRALCFLTNGDCNKVSSPT